MRPRLSTCSCSLPTGGLNTLLRSLWGLALILPLVAALPAPAFVPEVAAGFAIAPLAPAPIATSIAFGPGDDLYYTTLANGVWRVDLEWTPAGPVSRGARQIATGFSTPLGLAFDGDVLYVADSTNGAESGRVDGRVTRIEPDGDRIVIVGGLPNGRHNTNNLRFGPDGRLYIANGNPNDNGIDGGDADVFPYSGAILSVDADALATSPAILRWRDASGSPIPASQIASHPRNADFAAKVDVLAFGFRNVYDVAFSPAGIAYTGTNGADDPPSQDLLYKIAPGTDYGFPFCYNEGTPGGIDARLVTNPTFPSFDCSGYAPATALLGWHVCATGLDVAPPGTFLDSIFVGECGPLFVDVVVQSLADAAHATHNTGHKVARVALDANGDATEVRDFVTGLHLPTDVLFGPDGAMYIADVDMIYRVVQLL